MSSAKRQGSAGTRPSEAFIAATTLPGGALLNPLASGGSEWISADEVRSRLNSLGVEITRQQVSADLRRMSSCPMPWLDHRVAAWGGAEYRITSYGLTGIINTVPWLAGAAKHVETERLRRDNPQLAAKLQALAASSTATSPGIDQDTIA